MFIATGPPAVFLIVNATLCPARSASSSPSPSSLLRTWTLPIRRSEHWI